MNHVVWMYILENAYLTGDKIIVLLILSFRTPHRNPLYPANIWCIWMEHFEILCHIYKFDSIVTQMQNSLNRHCPQLSNKCEQNNFEVFELDTC